MYANGLLHNALSNGHTTYHTQRKTREHHRKIPHIQTEQTKLALQRQRHRRHYADFRAINTKKKTQTNSKDLRPSERATRSSKHAPNRHVTTF